MTLNPKTFLEALRGEYAGKQGRGSLRTSVDCFCQGGVACDLLVKDPSSGFKWLMPSGVIDWWILDTPDCGTFQGTTPDLVEERLYLQHDGRFDRILLSPELRDRLQEVEKNIGGRAIENLVVANDAGADFNLIADIYESGACTGGRNPLELMKELTL